MVWCASGLSEPSDMALAMKRFTRLDGGSTSVNLQLRTGGIDLQQIAQDGGLAFVRRARVRRPSFGRSERGGGLRRGAGCTDSHLQIARALRLPGVRLGTIGATEAHPAIVGKFGTFGLGFPRRTQRRFDVGEVLAAHGRGGSWKAEIGDLGVEAEDVEQLRGAIAVEDGDAHLRHDFREAGVEDLQQASFAFVAGERTRGLQREPRTYGCPRRSR